MFFWHLKSQILPIKNVAAFLDLYQNEASKSNVLKRNLVSKNGHLGVASAFFEIDLYLPQQSVLLPLKIAGSARDKKRRHILRPKWKWSLKNRQFWSGFGRQKVAILAWRRRFLKSTCPCRDWVFFATYDLRFYSWVERENLATFFVLNQNGASKSQVLKRAWESESGHFGVASAPFEIDLSFLRFGVFCRLSSQILLVVKNVTAFSVLSQNGTSKSHVLKRNLVCKSGHLGVASALFEIDLSLMWFGFFLTLEIAGSARDKKRSPQSMS